MGALEQNTTLIHGIHLRESADDGSDFSNAAADYRVLFLGEDGFLHVKDSAGSVADPYDTSGGGASPVYDIERYTGGDITVSSSSAGADLSGVSDVVVAAVAGDLLMIGVSFRMETSNSTSVRIDVKFITGATENYLSSETTTPAGQGVSGWFVVASSVNATKHGEQPYVVQAADISGGNVTCSLRAWLSGSGNWVMAADSDAPLKFWVRNLGQ